MEKPTHLRTIKSFVKRKGRTTLGQQQALQENIGIYGLDISHKFDLSAIFQNNNPVTLEIGFGMGTSLFNLALNNPTQNFIGIEVHEAGVGTILNNIKSNDLKNIRIINIDAHDILSNCLEDNSLHKVIILFPDPWHKKKHNKRRIIQPTFIELVARKLQIGGTLHFATDWEEYALEALDKLNSSSLRNQSPDNTFVARPNWREITKFEQRGLNLGHKIFDLSFEKV
jgi:tRNA (guanine-N7-)-methyltransferase